MPGHSHTHLLPGWRAPPVVAPVVQPAVTATVSLVAAAPPTVASPVVAPPVVAALAAATAAAAAVVAAAVVPARRRRVGGGVLAWIVAARVIYTFESHPQPVCVQRGPTTPLRWGKSRVSAAPRLEVCMAFTPSLQPSGGSAVGRNAQSHRVTVRLCSSLASREHTLLSGCCC